VCDLIVASTGDAEHTRAPSASASTAQLKRTSALQIRLTAIMATGQFQASLRSTDDIKKWQIQTCDGDEAIVSTANVPMVSTLYDGLMSFLKVILAHARDQKPEPTYYASLEESIASLFFWGRDFGVSQGELDMALQFSHRLRDTVLTLLISLGDLLSLGIYFRCLPKSCY
jgi:hypothetical protein